MKCRLSTEKVKSSLAASIVQHMLQREKSRVNKYGQETLPALFDYPGFKAAILFDPRLMSILTEDDVNEAKAYLKGVWKRLEKVQGEAEADGLTLDSGDAGASDDDEDDFSAFMRNKNNERIHREGSKEAQIDSLLNLYVRTTKSLPLKANIIEYWETQKTAQPELYALATTVLAIPATQVSVERLFSSLAFILGPLRNNLGSQRVDDLLLLHANDDVAKEAHLGDVEVETEDGEVEMSRPSSVSVLSSSSFSWE